MAMQTDSNSAYVPGVCNINKNEIAYRRKSGYFGLAATAGMFLVLYFLNINELIRLVLFVPAYISAIGFLQAKNKFCVAYGASARQNATEKSSSATVVTDTVAILRDKIKARSLNIQAVIIALAVALLACLI